MADGRRRARQIECRWCGKDHTAYSHLTKFCSEKCKLEFNELRKKRAPLVYDAYMAGRFDRRNNKGYLTTLAQIGRQYRDEDIRDRAGRQSWADAGYHKDDNYIDRLRDTPAPANEESYDGEAG